MKSTTLIHEITADFGGDDPDKLRRNLKSLRTQVKNEVLGKVKNCTGLIKLLYNE
jgi:hypothetical protein